jgi:hypothetical protein
MYVQSFLSVKFMYQEKQAALHVIAPLEYTRCLRMMSVTLTPDAFVFRISILFFTKFQNKLFNILWSYEF